jgi:hypothetical protein
MKWKVQKMANEKRLREKMTKEQAVHILMHLDSYVEYDEDIGILVKSPLMDACVLAIRALKADAVEVVHGRLIPSFANVDCHCSVCRAEFDNILSKAVERWNYCPNCGAKMDLKEI